MVVTVTALVLALLAIAIQFEFLRAALGGGTTDDTPERTNCTTCGARVPVDTGACPHCDASLDGD